LIARLWMRSGLPTLSAAMSEFSHNGVRCIALAGGSANALVERWGYEIKRKVTVPNDFRLATSRPANPTIAKEPQE
jgi:hypothetical protein